jgi:hypothetical protein
MSVGQFATETRQRTSRHPVTDAKPRRNKPSFVSILNVESFHESELQLNTIVIIFKNIASTILVEERKKSVFASRDEPIETVLRVITAYAARLSHHETPRKSSLPRRGIAAL